MCNNIPLVVWHAGWPAEDQRLWASLFEEGGFLEESGAGAHWKDGTRRTREQGYGQWMSFLMRTDPKALVLPPIGRITQHRVGLYLEELKPRVKAITICNLVTALSVVAKLFGPDQDWAWLKRAQKRLQSELSDVSVPPALPITASQIFHFSIEQLEALKATSAAGISPLKRAIKFRQWLMSAFLAARPIRRRALLAMEVKQHLIRTAEGFQMHFRAEDMKDKKNRDFPLPEALVVLFQDYLDVYRPVLLRGKESQAFWISQNGNPITKDGLSRELPKVMKRHFGVAMRPHAFRHVAATSIAEADPEHVGIMKDILGHATLAMAEKH